MKELSDKLKKMEDDHSDEIKTLKDEINQSKVNLQKVTKVIFKPIFNILIAPVERSFNETF